MMPRVSRFGTVGNDECDPFDLYDALAGAMAEGRHGWREPIVRSLTELNREKMLEEHGI